jgi:hypothetical protein
VTDEPKVPATREDVENAKTAIIKHLTLQNKETRAHIGNEIATVRNERAHDKNFSSRTFTAIKKLLTKFGIGTDDL